MLLICCYVLISPAPDMMYCNVFSVVLWIYILSLIISSTFLAWWWFISWLGRQKYFYLIFQHFYFPRHKQLRITQYIYISPVQFPYKLKWKIFVQNFIRSWKKLNFHWCQFSFHITFYLQNPHEVLISHYSRELGKFLFPYRIRW